MDVLVVLGRPVVFGARQELCMPPHVPVPKPGPCPGSKRGLKKAAETIDKVADKVARKHVPKAKATRSPAPRKTATPGRSPATVQMAVGRDIREQIDYDKLETLFAPKRGDIHGEDQRLAEIARMQGFDAPPRLASKSELDAMVSAGALELFRGTEDGKDGTPGAEFARRFREGPARYGFGFFGNGVYAADNYEEARRFARGAPGGVNRMVVDPNAKIIDYDELVRQARADSPPELLHRREQDQRTLMDLIRDASTEAEMDAAFEAFNKIGSRGKAKDLLTTDPSLYAMAKGHDLVRVSDYRTGEGQPYYVILNHTALTAEQPSPNSPTSETPAAPTAAKKTTATAKTAATATARKTAVPKTTTKTTTNTATKTTGQVSAPPAKKAAAQAPVSADVQAARDHADNLIKSGKVPAPVREDVRQALYAMADKAPKGIRSLQGVGIGAGEPGEPIDPNGMFQYMPRSRTIAISPRFATKAGRNAYERAIASSMADGYLTPSGLPPLAGSMAHEFGHHLVLRRMSVGQAGMPRAIALPVLTAIARQIGVSPPRVRPQGDILYEKEINPWWTANRSRISRAIGEYAAESIHEAIAEGFQEGATMGSRARPYATEIAGLLLAGQTR